MEKLSREKSRVKVLEEQLAESELECKNKTKEMEFMVRELDEK